MEFHFERGFKPLYVTPVVDATIESLSLTGDDVQLLAKLASDNTVDGARPVLTKHSERFIQAERLSQLGLIALEQLPTGVRLHISKLGTRLAHS
jgi:hypothetical protein